MGLFKRWKHELKPGPVGPVCSNCGSTNTTLALFHGYDHPDFVRAWRGQRFVTYKCRDCCREFYVDGSQAEIPDEEPDVYDPEALREAEEELKRLADEENDHTCR